MDNSPALLPALSTSWATCHRFVELTSSVRILTAVAMTKLKAADTSLFSDGSTPSGISETAASGTQSADASGDASLAFAQSPISLAGVFISSLLALGSGIAILA